MKNEEKILWQINQRGDEFLQNISLLLIRFQNEGYATEYGEQKEKDKGRDIIRYDENMFYSEVIQVKYSKVLDKLFSKKMFLEELSKTLIYIALDSIYRNQNHIDFKKKFTFGLLLNYKYDKKILDINSEIKGNIEAMAKILFDNRNVKKNKSFVDLKYIDIKDELIKILKVLKIIVYNSRYLYEMIIQCPTALFQFNDISFEIAKLIDKNETLEIEKDCKNNGMKFLNELEKIEYDKFTKFYTYAIEDYAKAFSVFNCLNLSYDIIENEIWENEYKAKIRRRYYEKKDQHIRKLGGDNIINTCKDFYCDVIVNLETATKIMNVNSNIDIERGLYHLEIEEGNLKGWRLDE